MQGPEDSRPVGPTAARRTPRRVAKQGAPLPRGDTLGAEGAPRDRKVKTKEKPKPARAPAKQRTEPLNFRVTPEFRHAFKRATSAEDCKRVELLERIFAEWSARNPG